MFAQSVKHHERGNKHKSNVQRFLIDQRKKKREEEFAKRDLEKTLREVNKVSPLLRILDCLRVFCAC